MNKIFLKITFAITLIVFGTASGDDESIVMNPNGDYVITYKSLTGAGDSGNIVRVVWVPRTKIDPKVHAMFKSNNATSGDITYSYKIKNGKSSRQFLEGGRLLASSLIQNSQMTPSGWKGTAVADAGRSAGTIISWGYWGDSIGGIKQGDSKQGFGFVSMDLPGVGIMELWGAAPAGQSFPDEGPSEISSVYARLGEIQGYNFVPLNTAVPKISVGNPFNVATVLTGIQQHLNTDLVSMKLVDPTLASQLDRLLQAAVDAAKLNNTKAIRHNIKDARKLLKTHCPDVDKDGDEDSDDNGKNKSKSPLIDKLAARVLDFDLKYVEKQLK